MSLLNVTVKRAKYVGEQSSQLNSYVNVKVQNVKTTTQCVKGAEPVWNQDFLFETTATANSGIIIEVWCKNLILDKALGFQYIPLDTLPYNQFEYPATYEQWFTIDGELVTVNGEVQGTRDPTGHMILLDLHFELPFDVDSQNLTDTSNKTMMMMNYQNENQYIENYGNEYNSQSVDYNNYQNNYGRGVGTPMSSLETSRQNSYERDERQYYDCNNYYNNSYPIEEDEDIYEDAEDGENYDDGALYYNSRPMSSTNYNRPTHRTVRQLSRRNLARQNTLLCDEDQDQYEPFDTCSELNYNSNYNNDDYGDNCGHQNNQTWQNGDVMYGDTGYSNSNKKLPQPPLSYSQSVNDGFGHRGASLPATPQRQRNTSRQLPKHTSPARGLPKLSRQLPNSIESAASTFSSLFSRRKAPDKQQPLPQQQQLDTIAYNNDNNEYVTDISYHMDGYNNTMAPSSTTTAYNENYNYAYRSMDSADELMDDGDNNNLVMNGRNSRYGAALPILPYGNEPMDSTVPSIDVQYDNGSYYGDEYYESSMYQTNKSELTPSPKKSKRLPSTAHQTPSTPSIMTAAGHGISSLFSSLSNSLHSAAVTTGISTSPSVMTASYSSAYNHTATSTSGYGGYGGYGVMSTAVPATSSYDILSSSTGFGNDVTGYESKASTGLFGSIFGSSSYGITATTTTNSYGSYRVTSSSYGAVTTPSSYGTVTSSYGPVTSSYGPVTSSYGTITSSYGPVTSSYSQLTSSYDPIASSYGLATSSYSPITSSYGPITSTPSYNQVTSTSTYGLVTSTSSYAPVTSSHIFGPTTSSYDAVTSSYGLPTTSYELTSTYGSSLTKTTGIGDYEKIGSGFDLETDKYGLESSKFGLDSSKFGIESSIYGSDGKYGLEVSKYGTEVSKYGPEMSKFGTEVSKYGPEVSKYDSDLSKFGSDVPKFGPDLSKYDPETTNYGHETSIYNSSLSKFASDPSKFTTELSKYGPEASNLGTVTQSYDTGYDTVTSLQDTVTTIGSAVNSLYDTVNSSYDSRRGTVTSLHESMSNKYDANKFDSGYDNYNTATDPLNAETSIYDVTKISFDQKPAFDDNSWSTDQKTSAYDAYNTPATSSNLDTYSMPTSTASYDYKPIASNFSATSATAATTSYASISNSLLNPYGPLKYDDDYAKAAAPSISISVPVTTTSSSILSPLTSLFTPSSATTTSSIYGGITSHGLLGHSPIPEEDTEALQEEDGEIIDDYIDPYTVNGDYIEPFVPATQSFTSADNFSSYTTTDTFANTLDIPTSAASMITSMRRISDPYSYLNEISEEYHEDFEEGVMPITVVETTHYDTFESDVVTTSLGSSQASGGGGFEYPFPTRLSTIHETSSDVYMSPSHETYDADQITPTAYDYRENEKDYLASGDLKNTNLMQSNSFAPYSTAPSTVAQAVTQQQQQQAGGQKKSLFGSLFSGGLDVLGSSVNAVKATATNLAQTAVGAAGAAAGAAVNATKGSGPAGPVSTQQQQQQQQQMQNGPYSVYTSAATTDAYGNTINNNISNNNNVITSTTHANHVTQRPPMLSKAVKQSTSIYDQQDDEYYDEDPYVHHQDSFNEEYEDEYLAQHQDSPEINNYQQYDNNSSYNNNNINNNVSRRSSARKSLERNDTNNNDGEYDDFGEYDEHNDGYYHHKPTTRHSVTGGINDELEAYAEEFEDDYGIATNSNNKSSIPKQMSVSDDAQHQQQQQLDDLERKEFEDECLDEFDVDRTMSSKPQHDISGYMKKQESIMEDDPELKQLEEQQQLKNQKIQMEMQQQLDLELLDADLKGKKSVTISEDEPMVHEKPREKRTAKQRWHWAYNRIVHQQQVSLGFYFFFNYRFYITATSSELHCLLLC